MNFEGTFPFSVMNKPIRDGIASPATALFIHGPVDMK
jgi:hypothetical protein